MVNPRKTLLKDVLDKNGYTDVASVAKLVSKGKGQMPAYGIKSKKLGLSPEVLN